MRNCLLFLSLFYLSKVHAQLTDFSKYVNPFIGTGGHGHTFPGATLPFAMVQLSPDTRIDGSWDGCSGYHYSDSIIYGFSHTHLSGTGCSDYGDIAFLPFFEENDNTILNSFVEKKGLTFNHKNESATVGYYNVKLDNNVNVELTTTLRCGMQQYHFAKNGYAYIKLDLTHRDELIEGTIIEEPYDDLRNYISYSGKRYSKAWAKNQKLFYSFQINALPIETKRIESSGKHQLLILKFKVNKNNPIIIKTGISGVDEEGARNNLQKEIPDWNFEKYKLQVRQIWEKELSKIKINDVKVDDSKKTIFYTALYHCMIHPSIFNDVDNRYRGRDDNIHTTNGKFDYYTVFSLWDTYRALHPLLTIIDKKRTNDFIHTFIKQYEHCGRLPVWELWGNETDCMIGYHAVSVIWDAYNKGIRNYNVEKAFEAMKSIANENTDALHSYKKYHYVRADDDAESVSKTLEYAYDDWCIAEMARTLGKISDYDTFINRSHYWMNVYDPTTSFMRARKNGSLYQPFSPYTVDNNYTEANSWQYSFYVPHQLSSLKNNFGSDKNFEKKLDELFSANTKTEGREQADITGLIGQYAHGNEPSHHIAYLYNTIGNFEKSKKITTQILDSFYSNKPDGLIGNEDCGQMSAWYVLSVLGLYPVCPGSENTFKIPSLYNATITDYGKSTLNVYTNTKRENYSYKTQTPSFVSNPYIREAPPIFKDSIKISMLQNNNDMIFYNINHQGFQFYKNPFFISENSEILFYATNKKNNSPIQFAKFIKLPSDRKILLKSIFNKSYSAGGAEGLIDGIRGSTNWRAGNWQGFQSQDFEATIILDTIKVISNVSATFLQDQRSWIFFPTEVIFSFSTDGINWTSDKQQILVPRNEDKNSIQTISNKRDGANLLIAKYLKIQAKNYGKLPAWHPGAGGDAFIFIDEIAIN